MNISQFELNDTELEEITSCCQDHFTVSLASSYHLFLFDVRGRSIRIIAQANLLNSASHPQAPGEVQTRSRIQYLLECRLGVHQDIYGEVDG
jgi:hypothetical protein